VFADREVGNPAANDDWKIIRWRYDYYGFDRLNGLFEFTDALAVSATRIVQCRRVFAEDDERDG